MKSLRMGWFAIVVLAIGCGSSSARESGKVTEIPGYVHTIERSRFILGDVVTQLDSSGMHKIVGTLGTFSSILASGAADAIPNHSIPDSSTRYHQNDAGQQDTEVHSYLESAGM